MDQATLVGPDVNVAREVFDTLEAAEIRLVVAALVVFPEYDDWRLVLSSPSLDQTHLLRAHDRVAEILHGRSSYALPTIMILPTKDPFVRALRALFGKTKNIEGMRLGGQAIGNRFVTDAVVYRIR